LKTYSCSEISDILGGGNEKKDDDFPRLPYVAKKMTTKWLEQSKNTHKTTNVISNQKLLREKTDIK